MSVPPVHAPGLGPDVEAAASWVDRDDLAETIPLFAGLVLDAHDVANVKRVEISGVDVVAALGVRAKLEGFLVRTPDGVLEDGLQRHGRQREVSSHGSAEDSLSWAEAIPLGGIAVLEDGFLEILIEVLVTRSPLDDGFRSLDCCLRGSVGLSEVW